MTPEEPLRLLILGAHPDDAEFHAGGLASAYCQMGHVVKMLSVTNGAAGHHFRSPEELAAIRRREAKASAEVIGAISEVWEYPDAHLQLSQELRHRIIREIRTFKPDLLLTHRPCDYHPDHRATGQAVQDASFLVRVPLVVPEAPALRRDPVIAYMTDLFTKPTPLAADVLLDVTDRFRTMVSMLACHRCQVFEFLPWLDGILETVPSDEAGRQAWLSGWYGNTVRPRADRYRKELLAAYGQERGSRIEYAEVLEISEYGSPLDAAARSRLFGFLPSTALPSRS